MDPSILIKWTSSSSFRGIWCTFSFYSISKVCQIALTCVWSHYLKHGFGHLLENKTIFSLRRTMTSLNRKLSERYTSYFKSAINEETKVKGRYITKLRAYKLFKTPFKKENYLLVSLPLDKQSLFSFSRLRVSNHKLEIELGRYKIFLLKKDIAVFVTLIR